jgi:hypothetical protein
MTKGLLRVIARLLPMTKGLLRVIARLLPMTKGLLRATKEFLRAIARHLPLVHAPRRALCAKAKDYWQYLYVAVSCPSPLNVPVQLGIATGHSALVAQS